MPDPVPNKQPFAARSSFLVDLMGILFKIVKNYGSPLQS